jgi:hypothetical protein
VRPQVTSIGEYIRIREYRRGILCQAKLKSASAKWGRFTKNQKKLLPERLPYLGLLLYRYRGRSRRVLAPFAWQICRTAARTAAFAEVEGWLRSDSFPSCIDSPTVIREVGGGRMGTDDDKTIDGVIRPGMNRCLEIKIYWPKGRPPDAQIKLSRVQSKHQVERECQITQQF